MKSKAISIALLMFSMKLVGSFITLIVLSISSMAYADSYVDICGRGYIRDKILAALDYDDPNDCHRVSAEKMASLKTLVFQWDDSITTIPANAFQGLTSLERLSFMGTNLTIIPSNAFQGLTSLKHLWFTGNNISVISEDAFQGLTSLEDLILRSEDVLTTIPANAFQGLTSLKGLSLYSNRIAQVPAKVFQGLTSLEVLDFEYNILAALPANVFQGLTSLKFVHLDGNDSCFYCKKGGRLHTISISELGLNDSVTVTGVDIDP